MKKHKPWFDNKCLTNLDQRNQFKMQWLQDRNQNIVNNLSNVRLAASGHFRKES
jgi:hypothetical protein